MPDDSANRPLRVFLCHASGDKPAVRDLYQRLRADGFAPWLDEEDLLPGQKWQNEIPKAVRNADVVLVSLSQYAINKTGYVQKEIKFALDVADEQPDDTIYLIPLKLEECDVPERLSHLQWVRFYDQGGYTRLTRSLHARAKELGLSQALPMPTAAPAPQPLSATADAVADDGRASLQRRLDDLRGNLRQIDDRRADFVLDTDIPLKLAHRGEQELRAQIANLEQLLSSMPAIAPTAPAPRSPASSTNVSGGVNLEANSVNVGRDMVGRDQINQTTIHIEHATIIQSGAAMPAIKSSTPASTNRSRVIGDMEFVCVPAGKFVMGREHNERAKPPHTIDLPYDYWLGRYPVTNEQFARFVAAAKYEFNQGQWQATANHPVVSVSWRDAMAYCQWLNNTLRGELKNWTLRLPTEAEWEKAARGAQGAEWPWGNEFDPSRCNTLEGGQQATTPVGAYSPAGDSPYGAADMAGNVWEWCRTLYKPYPYQATDGRESEAGNDERVLRGGAWSLDQANARCACRNVIGPDIRRISYGFRCCYVPDDHR